MKNSAFLILMLLNISFSAFGQGLDLREDTLFFNRQKPEYKKWLDKIGMSEFLSIKQWNINKSKIQLKLDFNYAMRDSATWAWQQLKTDFEKVNALTLEESLFLKIANLMEVDLKYVSLNVRNKHLPQDLPAIDNDIFFDTLQQKIIVKEAGYRSSVEDSVYIPQYKLKKQLNQQDILIKVANNLEELQSFISDKLKAKFEDYFNWKVDIQSRGIICRNPFIFEASGIKSLVVVPASQFGIFNPTEKVTYIIKYKKNKNEIKIFCTIDGKYGSGLIKPRTLNGYGDMFPKYQEELNKYARRFTQDTLFQWMLDIFNEK